MGEEVMRVLEITVNQAVIALVGFGVTTLLGYCLGKLKRLSKVEKARISIEKASARAHVLAAYEKYIIGGAHMTVARYEELLEEYEAYTILGGNGTAKRYMEEIKELKPYLVTD